ncbi:hypothetical protein ACNTMW_31160 [Planosporangium sp. 12N6]|uniref:hypothetical protein n=1 Tax=Planosporangium spinosum TaxID=3402278 RepID=UPI003CEC0659
MSGKSATTSAARPTSRFHPVSVRFKRLPTQQEARAALGELRMPGTPDPQLRLRRLLGVCAWAGTLGFFGLIIGMRIVFGIFTHIPGWYLAVTFTLGLPGIAATVVAFATLHKGRLPWKLLGVASAAEAVSFGATLLL